MHYLLQLKVFSEAKASCSSRLDQRRRREEKKDMKKFTSAHIEDSLWGVMEPMKMHYGRTWISQKKKKKKENAIL